jgi:hypothetical protein
VSDRWPTVTLAEANDFMKPEYEKTAKRASGSLDPVVMWRQAQVTLYIKLPGEMSPKAVTLHIGEPMAECMRPLPRNREIAWEVRDQQQAREMIQARQQAAKHIAEHITAALLDAFKAKDTINGYSPEEWATMQPHNEKGQR